MLLLVDLDGVVYRGDHAVPGMPQLLARRAAAGDRVVYVTNNSRWHRDEYRARLAALGAPLEPDPAQSIVTAARATAVLIAGSDPQPDPVMVLGGPGLGRELRDVGLRTVAPNERGLAARPQALAVGVDFSLSYERLSISAEAVRRGARFVATNRDPIYPTPTGLTAGAGSIVAAVAVAAGREPDLVVGKPEPLLFEIAASLAGVPVNEAVVIGDGLGTDVRAAITVGARSVLMLTGVTTAADLARAPEGLRPTAIAGGATELERILSQLPGRSPRTP